MHRTLIPISIMFSLGVVVSLLYSAGGWADGTAPASRGIGPAGGAWLPWNYGGQGAPAVTRSKTRHVRHGHTRRGYLILPGRVFGPPIAYGGVPYPHPGYWFPPRAWFGYGPGPSAAPGYPGRSRHRPHRLTPRQPAPDAWAPDESGDVYRGFTSPPASVAGGELARETSVASDLEAVPPVEEPVGETPMPIPPAIEATAGVVREAPGLQAAPPLEVETSVEPLVLDPQAETRVAPLPPVPDSEEDMAGEPEPLPSGAAAGAVELGVPTVDGLPPAADVSGQEVEATAEIKPLSLTPPPAAPVVAIEPEVKTAAEAVAEDTPALAEEAPVAADGGVTETPAAVGSAQEQTAEPAAGEGAEAAEGQRRTLVERWLSPKPVAR